MNRKLTLGVFAAASALALGSCSTAQYYWQGISGELDLLDRAQPIPSVVESTSDPALKEKLEHTLQIRDFASTELGLPNNASYRRYTSLDRPYVLWNVFATPALSLEPAQWCFPVAGCVNYRGYFSEEDAKSEAMHLAGRGDDVYIGGVPAYSTLGYFDDPVLSTIIRYPETEVARLIFHELAHQIAYAKDDTVFNESFAVTVEEVGVERWLAKRNDPQLTAQFELAQRQRQGFLDLVRGTRSRLQKLYTSAGSDEQKRAGKAAIFAAMRSDYEAQKASWGGAAGYDSWFARGANNAAIVAVGLYSEKVPQFRALLGAEGGDLQRFYARVKELSRMPKAERERVLAALVPSNGVAALHR